MTVAVGTRRALKLKEPLHVACRSTGEWVQLDCVIKLEVVEQWLGRPVYRCTCGTVELGKFREVEHTAYKKVGRFRHDFTKRRAWQEVDGNHRIYHKSQKAAVLQLVRNWLYLNPEAVLGGHDA